MTTPRVSVVTIFFNAERFIEEAIESVLSQTFASWELLLVDDGSTDGSPAIARRYAAKYPERVTYLQQADGQNHGMSAARNVGLRQATAEYVAFLDSDDVWFPMKLERQVAILDAQKDAIMVFGPALRWYSWFGPTTKRDYVSELGFRPNRLIRPPKVLSAFLANEDIAPCTCSVLIRRWAVVEVGGFEVAFRGMYEDQAFFAKVCLRFPAFASGECLAKYRRHGDSSCAVARERGEQGTNRLRFLQWLETHLEACGILEQFHRAIEVERRRVAGDGASTSLVRPRPGRDLVASLRQVAGRWRRRWKT